ncbi:MAG: DoxX family protein [Hyphomicrobiales bacterium]|jgi:putative oxidoreductase|nr:DoxX family protein [Hyphomicrobiales bacterium]
MARATRTRRFEDAALLLGRLLMAALFLVAAYGKIMGYAGTIGYFRKLGVPEPSIAVPASIFAELAMGLLMLVGYQTRLAALAIAAFSVVSALLAHFNFGDANQMNHFLKNFAIAGGALAFFVSGAGAYSLDASRRL